MASSSASTAVTPSPTATSAHYKISLAISKTFVTYGSTVTLTGKVTSNGAAVSGAHVALSEKYSDGKVVPLGTFTTTAAGTFSHVDKPLYIGSITAKTLGVTSNPVSSRVIITYRKIVVAHKGDVVTVTTGSRPGFVTGTNRAERVELFVNDSKGLVKRLIVNAGARKSAPGEAQGYNPITFTGITLEPGRYSFVVKVLGTPVNTGAVSKAVKLTL